MDVVLRRYPSRSGRDRSAGRGVNGVVNGVNGVGATNGFDLEDDIDPPTAGSSSMMPHAAAAMQVSPHEEHFFRRIESFGYLTKERRFIKTL